MKNDSTEAPHRAGFAEPGTPSSEADGDAAAAPEGLVSCAKVETSAESLFGTLLAFPSAQMLQIAAALWPDAPSAYDSTDWVVRGLDKRAPSKHGVYVANEWAEFQHAAPGIYPALQIAPGMVRLLRKDHARAEESRIRREAAEVKARHSATETMRDDRDMPMALAPSKLHADHYEAGVPFAPLEETPGRVVSAFSRKSQSALRKKIASLDLSGLVAGETIPAMVTLTLPGDWLAVAPDAATMAAKFHKFTMAYVSKWGGLATIWKREFQRRGAPHYHLWLVPPAGVEMSEYREWLSTQWTRTLFADAPCSGSCESGKRDGVPGTIVCHHCEERRRSLAAGTGLDFAAALRARDPNRLAEYFLKESGHSEAKAYQNAAPAEWAGQSIGRFWGVRGIPEAVVTIDVHPDDQYRIWRVMRKVRRARGLPTRQWTVTRTTERTNQRTGEVVARSQRRTVTRRTRVTAIAGWVAVNDGANFGARLGEYASQLAAARDAGAAS